jgi:hypothetical protein
MNKPNPEFEIDDPTEVDDQGRSPNKEELIDPDARERLAGTNRSGDESISGRPGDEDGEASAVDNDTNIEDDSDSTGRRSASDNGEAGDLGRDAGATQGSQKMDSSKPSDER